MSLYLKAFWVAALIGAAGFFFIAGTKWDDAADLRQQRRAEQETRDNVEGVDVGDDLSRSREWLCGFLGLSDCVLPSELGEQD